MCVCLVTASRLLEAMDPTVDPCDDFFEYACGTWNRVNVIPNDKPRYDTFRKLGDELQTSLKGMLYTQWRNNNFCVRGWDHVLEFPFKQRERPRRLPCF